MSPRRPANNHQNLNNHNSNNHSHHQYASSYSAVPLEIGISKKSSGGSQNNNNMSNVVMTHNGGVVPAENVPLCAEMTKTTHHDLNLALYEVGMKENWGNTIIIQLYPYIQFQSISLSPLKTVKKFFH